MIKKITALIIALCMCLPLTSVAYETKEYNGFSAQASEAAKLIEVLCGESADMTKASVSRGEFLELLIKLITKNLPFGTDSAYDDIEKGTSLSYCACYANKSGIISDAQSFLPDNPVSAYQAVKMAVSALGYNDLAVVRGGYPVGYMSIASDIDLADGIDLSSELLSMTDVCTLLYNMLNAELYEISGIYDTYAQYERKGNTVLGRVHGISVIEGTVTANKYTSLTSPEDGTGSDSVTLGAYTVSTKEGGRYLGMNVKAFVSGSSPGYTALAIIPSDNTVTSFNTDDYPEYENGKILLGSDKQKKFSLSKAPVYILNGKNADISDIDSLLENNEITAYITDNDSDGEYDVITVNTWKYCTVKTANVYEGIIADKNSPENNIDFSSDECEYEIKGENITDIYDISEGMLLAFTVSEDKRFVNIEVMESIQKLSPDGITESEVYAGEQVFRIGEYFKKYCAPYILFGEPVSVILGINGEAVSMSEHGDTAAYGYVIAHTGGTGLENPKLKLISQDGKTYIFDIPEKISADGIKTSQNALIDKLESQISGQRLIRYRASADGILKNIDFCTDSQDVPSVNNNDRDNSLLFYSEGTYQYKSQAMTLSDKFNISLSKVFIVPTDETSASDYRVSTANIFNNDQKLNLRIYDVSSTLDAGAVVWVSDATNSVSSSARSNVVYSVTNALDSNGDICYCLTVFNGSSYVKYFSDEKTEAEISSLYPGDIVRLAVSDDGEHIDDIVREYSCRDDILLSGYSSGGIIDYIKGYVYDSTKSQLSIIAEDRSDTVNPLKDNLLTASVPGDYIFVHVNTYTDGTPYKARAVTYPGQAVQGYLTVGDSASYAVVERNYYSTRNVFVYIFEQ